jgi:outer membrane protein
VAAATFGITVPASAQTLTDALISAYQTNPLLKINRAGLREADESVAQARAARRPTLTQSLSLSRSYDLENGSAVTEQIQGSLTAGLLLYDGGQSKAAIEAARMAVLANRQRLAALEQSVLLDAVTAFMDVRRDLAFLRLSENNVRVLRQQVQAAEDRFEVGEVTRTDVSQAEARLAAAKSNLELNRGSLRNSQQTYEAVVGAVPGNLQAPPPAPKVPTKVSVAETIAVRTHPRILEAQFNAKSAEFNLKRTKLNRRPVLTGQVRQTLGRTLEGGNPFVSPQTRNLSVSLSGNMNIYQGGSLDSLRRQALALLQRRNSEMQQAGLLTRRSVNFAVSNLRVSQASIVARRQQVRSAKVAFDGVQEEAKLGARTTLDALNAEQEFLSAKSELVSAQRDAYVAAYTVLSEMGLLSVKHLRLGIEPYDPDVYYNSVNGASKFGAARGQLLDKLLKRSGQ